MINEQCIFSFTRDKAEPKRGINVRIGKFERKLGKF